MIKREGELEMAPPPKFGSEYGSESPEEEGEEEEDESFDGFYRKPVMKPTNYFANLPSSNTRKLKGHFTFSLI